MSARLVTDSDIDPLDYVEEDYRLLEQIIEHADANATRQPPPLLTVLKSYEIVLSTARLNPEQDTRLYRFLLKLSLFPDGGSWRRRLASLKKSFQTPLQKIATQHWVRHLLFACLRRWKRRLYNEKGFERQVMQSRRSRRRHRDANVNSSSSSQSFSTPGIDNSWQKDGGNIFSHSSGLPDSSFADKPIRSWLNSSFNVADDAHNLQELRTSMASDLSRSMMSSLSMNTPRGVHDLSAVLEDENEPSSSHSNIHHTPNPFSDVSRLLHASQMSHTAVDDAEQFLGLGERNRYDVSHLFSPKEGVAATPADAPRAGSSSSRSPGKHKKARARSMSPSKRKGYTFSRSSRGLMPSGDENEARTGKPNASTTRSQSRSRSMSPGKRSRHRNGPQFLSHSMRTTLASRSGGRLRYSPLSSSLTTPLRGVDPRSLSSSFARASAHALHASSSSPDTYARHNRNRQQLGYRAKTIEEVDELLKRTAFSNELAYYQFLTMGRMFRHWRFRMEMIGRMRLREQELQASLAFAALHCDVKTRKHHFLAWKRYLAYLLRRGRTLEQQTNETRLREAVRIWKNGVVVKSKYRAQLRTALEHWAYKSTYDSFYAWNALWRRIYKVTERGYRFSLQHWFRPWRQAFERSRDCREFAAARQRTHLVESLRQWRDLAAMSQHHTHAVAHIQATCNQGLVHEAFKTWLALARDFHAADELRAEHVLRASLATWRETREVTTIQSEKEALAVRVGDAGVLRSAVAVWREQMILKQSLEVLELKAEVHTVRALLLRWREETAARKRMRAKEAQLTANADDAVCARALEAWRWALDVNKRGRAVSNRYFFSLWKHWALESRHVAGTVASAGAYHDFSRALAAVRLLRDNAVYQKARRSYEGLAVEHDTRTVLGKALCAWKERYSVTAEVNAIGVEVAGLHRRRVFSEAFGWWRRVFHTHIEECQHRERTISNRVLRGFFDFWRTELAIEADMREKTEVCTHRILVTRAKHAIQHWRYAARELKLDRQRVQSIQETSRSGLLYDCFQTWLHQHDYNMRISAAEVGVITYTLRRVFAAWKKKWRARTFASLIEKPYLASLKHQALLRWRGKFSRELAAIKFRDHTLTTRHYARWIRNYNIRFDVRALEERVRKRVLADSLKHWSVLCASLGGLGYLAATHYKKKLKMKYLDDGFHRWVAAGRHRIERETNHAFIHARQTKERRAECYTEWRRLFHASRCARRLSLASGVAALRELATKRVVEREMTRAAEAQHAQFGLRKGLQALHGHMVDCGNAPVVKEMAVELHHANAKQRVMRAWATFAHAKLQTRVWRLDADLFRSHRTLRVALHTWVVHTKAQQEAREWESHLESTADRHFAQVLQHHAVYRLLLNVSNRRICRLREKPLQHLMATHALKDAFDVWRAAVAWKQTKWRKAAAHHAVRACESVFGVWKANAQEMKANRALMARYVPSMLHPGIRRAVNQWLFVTRASRTRQQELAATCESRVRTTDLRKAGVVFKHWLTCAAVSIQRRRDVEAFQTQLSVPWTPHQQGPIASRHSLRPAHTAATTTAPASSFSFFSAADRASAVPLARFLPAGDEEEEEKESTSVRVALPSRFSEASMVAVAPSAAPGTRRSHGEAAVNISTVSLVQGFGGLTLSSSTEDEKNGVHTAHSIIRSQQQQQQQESTDAESPWAPKQAAAVSSRGVLVVTPASRDAAVEHLASRFGNKTRLVRQCVNQWRHIVCVRVMHTWSCHAAYHARLRRLQLHAVAFAEQSRLQRGLVCLMRHAHQARLYAAAVEFNSVRRAARSVRVWKQLVARHRRIRLTLTVQVVRKQHKEEETSYLEAYNARQQIKQVRDQTAVVTWCANLMGSAFREWRYQLLQKRIRLHNEQLVKATVNANTARNAFELWYAYYDAAKLERLHWSYAASHFNKQLQKRMLLSWFDYSLDRRDVYETAYDMYTRTNTLNTRDHFLAWREFTTLKREFDARIHKFKKDKLLSSAWKCVARWQAFARQSGDERDRCHAFIQRRITGNAFRGWFRAFWQNRQNKKLDKVARWYSSNKSYARVKECFVHWREQFEARRIASEFRSDVNQYITLPSVFKAWRVYAQRNSAACFQFSSKVTARCLRTWMGKLAHLRELERLEQELVVRRMTRKAKQVAIQWDRATRKTHVLRRLAVEWMDMKLVALMQSMDRTGTYHKPKPKKELRFLAMSPRKVPSPLKKRREQPAGLKSLAIDDVGGNLDTLADTHFNFDVSHIVQDRASGSESHSGLHSPFLAPSPDSRSPRVHVPRSRAKLPRPGGVVEAISHERPMTQREALESITGPFCCQIARPSPQYLAMLCKEVSEPSDVLPYVHDIPKYDDKNTEGDDYVFAFSARVLLRKTLRFWLNEMTVTRKQRIESERFKVYWALRTLRTHREWQQDNRVLRHIGAAHFRRTLVQRHVAQWVTGAIVLQKKRLLVRKADANALGVVWRAWLRAQEHSIYRRARLAAIKTSIDNRYALDCGRHWLSLYAQARALEGRMLLAARHRKLYSMQRHFKSWRVYAYKNQALLVLQRVATVRHNALTLLTTWHGWCGRVHYHRKQRELLQASMQSRRQSTAARALRVWVERTAQSKRITQSERDVRVHVVMKKTWLAWRSAQRASISKTLGKQAISNWKRMLFDRWVAYANKNRACKAIQRVATAYHRREHLSYAMAAWRDNVVRAAHEAHIKALCIKSLKSDVLAFWRLRLDSKIETREKVAVIRAAVGERMLREYFALYRVNLRRLHMARTAELGHWFRTLQEHCRGGRATRVRLKQVFGRWRGEVQVSHDKYAVAVAFNDAARKREVVQELRVFVQCAVRSKDMVASGAGLHRAKGLRNGFTVLTANRARHVLVRCKARQIGRHRAKLALRTAWSSWVKVFRRQFHAAAFMERSDKNRLRMCYRAMLRVALEARKENEKVAFVQDKMLKSTKRVYFNKWRAALTFERESRSRVTDAEKDHRVSILQRHFIELRSLARHRRRLYALEDAHRLRWKVQPAWTAWRHVLFSEHAFTRIQVSFNLRRKFTQWRDITRAKTHLERKWFKRWQIAFVTTYHKRVAAENVLQKFMNAWYERFLVAQADTQAKVAAGRAKCVNRLLKQCVVAWRRHTVMCVRQAQHMTKLGEERLVARCFSKWKALRARVAKLNALADHYVVNFQMVDKLSFYFNAWVSARRKSAKIIAFMEERELRYAAHCMRLWVGKLHQTQYQAERLALAATTHNRKLMALVLAQWRVRCKRASTKRRHMRLTSADDEKKVKSMMDTLLTNMTSPNRPGIEAHEYVSPAHTTHRHTRNPHEDPNSPISAQKLMRELGREYAVVRSPNRFSPRKTSRQ